MKKVVSAILYMCIVIIFLSSCTAIERVENDREKGLHAETETVEQPQQDQNVGNNLEQEDFNQEISLYFFNRNDNTLFAEIRRIMASQSGVSFSQIVDSLAAGPLSPELEGVIPRNTKLLSASHIEDVVTVNLSQDFLQTDNLIVARAALVNTLVELDNVEFVRILIEGQEMTFSGMQDGEILGVLPRFPNNISEIEEKEMQETIAGEFRTLDWELFFKDRDGKLLISEVRAINVSNREYAKAIVEELIKGPSLPDVGLYRAIPAEVRLLEANIVKSEVPETRDTLMLLFSEEFKFFITENIDSFKTSVGTLVFSLTSLSNVGRVGIMFENENTTGAAVVLDFANLKEGFTRDDFTEILGRRIRVYFSDSNAVNLVPEYRAMLRSDLRIARKILNELIEGPLYDGNVAVMPDNLSVDDLRIWVEQSTAYVDLPQTINLNQMGSTGETMAIYAMVNSLTDSINTRNIEKVQFLVEGQIVDAVGHLSLREPFFGNPSLINDK